MLGERSSAGQLGATRADGSRAGELSWPDTGRADPVWTSLNPLRGGNIFAAVESLRAYLWNR